MTIRAKKLITATRKFEATLAKAEEQGVVPKGMCGFFPDIWEDTTVDELQLDFAEYKLEVDDNDGSFYIVLSVTKEMFEDDDEPEQATETPADVQGSAVDADEDELANYTDNDKAAKIATVITDAKEFIAKKLSDRTEKVFKLCFGIHVCKHFYLNNLKGKLFAEMRPVEDEMVALKDAKTKFYKAYLAASDGYLDSEEMTALYNHICDCVYSGYANAVWDETGEIGQEMLNKLGEETLMRELAKITDEFGIKRDLLNQSDSCNFKPFTLDDEDELADTTDMDAVTYCDGEFFSVYSYKYRAELYKDFSGKIRYFIFDKPIIDYADDEDYNHFDYEVSREKFFSVLKQRGAFTDDEAEQTRPTPEAAVGEETERVCVTISVKDCFNADNEDDSELLADLEHELDWIPGIIRYRVDAEAGVHATASDDDAIRSIEELFDKYGLNYNRYVFREKVTVINEPKPTLDDLTPETPAQALDWMIEAQPDELKDEIRDSYEPYKAEFFAAIDGLYLNDLSSGYSADPLIIPAVDLLQFAFPLALTDHSDTAYRKNPDGSFTEDRAAFKRLELVENKIFNVVTGSNPEPPVEFDTQRFALSDKQIQVAKDVAASMNAQAPHGWAVTFDTEEGEYHIDTPEKIHSVDTITAGDYLNPQEFFKQFGTTDDGKSIEERWLDDRYAELHELREMRKEIARDYPHEVEQIAKYDDMIDGLEMDIAEVELDERDTVNRICKAGAVDREGNIWF